MPHEARAAALTPHLKEAMRYGDSLSKPSKKLAVLVLAALISYSTGSLACGLARCLALTAAALYHRCFQALLC